MESFYRVQSLCGRSSPASEDVAVIDQAWAFCNSAVDAAGFAAIGFIDDTNGALAVPGSGDFDNLLDAYEDFLFALSDFMPQWYVWEQIKVVRADSAAPTPNTPVATRAVSLDGTDNDANAPQSAMSVTLETAIRRRWGRFYIPGPARGHQDTYGRFDDAVVDAAEASYLTLAGTQAGNHWFPIVLVNGWPLPGQAHTVTAVRCDNVPDVIRRRRFDAATYRKRDTIPP